MHLKKLYKAHLIYIIYAFQAIENYYYSFALGWGFAQTLQWVLLTWK